MMHSRFAVAVLAVVFLAACGGERQDSKKGEATPKPAEILKLPAACYGTWALTDSSGGIRGTGEDVPDGVLLIIGEDAIERRAPGTPAVRGSFTVSRGRTIFTTEPGWFIESQDLALAGVVEVSEDGRHLTISQNHYDGFNWHYRRQD
jgi:hypothetical protein